MIPNEITFEFEGVEYRCPIDAYYLNRILLPDGRVLSVEGWLERNPPKPAAFTVERNLNAAIATKV